MGGVGILFISGGWNTSGIVGPVPIRGVSMSLSDLESEKRPRIWPGDEAMETADVVLLFHW